MKRLAPRAIDGPTSRTLRRFARLRRHRGVLATRISPRLPSLASATLRGPTTRFRDRPARLRRLEPGVFSGQAVAVALEAGGRAEQKHARLLAAQVGVGVRRERTSIGRAVGTGD